MGDKTSQPTQSKSARQGGKTVARRRAVLYDRCPAAIERCNAMEIIVRAVGIDVELRHQERQKHNVVPPIQPLRRHNADGPCRQIARTRVLSLLDERVRAGFRKILGPRAVFALTLQLLLTA